MDFEEEWSIDIPDEYDSSVAVAQFKQHLYEYWKRGDGPCHRCPSRTFKDGCHPAPGKGPADADLLLVGHAPGPRVRGMEVDKKGREVDPATIGGRDEFDGFPLFAFYGDKIEDIENWRGISTLRKNLFESECGLDLDITDIYFTNSKKCSDIRGNNNREALRRCGSYLSKEIALVDSTVIVTWGREAAIGTARSLGYDTNRLPGRTMSLPGGDVNPTGSFVGYRETTPYLVTMPHWTGLQMGGNSRNIPDFDADAYSSPVKQIYYELADLVSELLGE